MATRKFDLNLLPIIVALYDERSVTLAAKRLGMSQPAVSKALARGRDALGDQLFIKTSLGMEPTTRAASMIAPMRNMLSSVRRDVLSGATFDPSSTETTFTLALSEVGELLALPHMIRNLQIVAPRASVNPVFPAPDELIDGLENGKIDLAIGVYPELRKNNFFRQRLLLSYAACLLRADHPIRSNRLSLKRYLALKHVAVRSGHSQQMVQKALGRGDLRRHVAIVTSHYLIIPEIVKNTDLVATILRALANYFASTHSKLKVVEAPREIPPVEIQQFWHRKYNDDPRSKWLRGLVKSIITGPRP